MALPSIPAGLQSPLAAVKFQEKHKLPKTRLDKLLARPGSLSGAAKGFQLVVWDCSINSNLSPIGSIASLNTKCFLYYWGRLAKAQTVFRHTAAFPGPPTPPDHRTSIHE